MNIDPGIPRRVNEAAEAIYQAIQEPDGLMVMEAMAALGIVIGNLFSEWPPEDRLAVMASWYATLQKAVMLEDDDDA